MNVFWRRAGAYVVDVVLLFALLAPIGWVVTQSLLGAMPTTGRQIWLTLLVNFSLPAWVYFTVSDASARGATFGKRWLGVRVARNDGGRPGVMQSLGRTAMKLLPWELVHGSAFALSSDLAAFSTTQAIGLTVANALAIVYLICAIVTRGRRSVHDFVVGTEVSLTGKSVSG